MRLDVERVRERVDPVELAQQALELGAVTQCDHRAEIAPIPGDRHSVDHQDVIVGHDYRVVAGHCPAQPRSQPRMRHEVLDRPPDRIAIERHQPPGLVVDEGHATVIAIPVPKAAAVLATFASCAGAPADAS